MRNRNPSTLTVMLPDGTEQVENVKTWWYNDLELIIEHHNGDVSSFPSGIIVE